MSEETYKMGNSIYFIKKLEINVKSIHKKIFYYNQYK